MTTEPLSPNRVMPGDAIASSVGGVVAAGQWFLDVESANYLAVLRVNEVIDERQSQHQLIQVLDVEEYGKTLILDGRIQMAESDEHIYHEMFVHAPMVWGRYETILVLGGGDGCIVRELLKWSCVRRILVVELDEQVVAACRAAAPEWTTGFDDSRVELVHVDAMSVMDSEEKFDLILADLTEPYDDSGAGGKLSSGLFSSSFYEGVKEKLGTDGIFAVQTGGFRLGRSSLDPHHVQLVNNIREVFEHIKVAYEFIPSFQAYWTITFASPSDFHQVDEMEELREMWVTFDSGIWDPINYVLDHNNVDTSYYDGQTHMRLFTPPIDQSEMYGWPEDDGGCCW